MPTEDLYKRVKKINSEILTFLEKGDIENTLDKLRERDECMQGGLINLEDEIIKRDQVLPVLEEIIRQDNKITQLLNQKIDSLKSSLTSASTSRKLRTSYEKKESRDEPRFLDKKG